MSAVRSVDRLGVLQLGPLAVVAEVAGDP